MPIRGNYTHKKKSVGLKPGDLGGQEMGLLIPSSVKETSNSVQHEQCWSNEATIHLAGKLRPSPATTDDHGRRGPVTLCSRLHSLIFNTQTQNRQSS
jgi:hypothetical protein